GGFPAAGGLRAPARSHTGTCAVRRDGRDLPPRAERVRRLLAARGSDARRIRERLFQNRRPGNALARWLFHVVWPQERSDHIGGIQYLSARDRGISAGAAWD